jgi:Acyl-CoA carboxylase epsilon subunit
MTTATAAGGHAPLIRIEKGQVSAEELAALTIALLTRVTSTQADRAATAPRIRPAACWRRHPHATAFPVPHSWQTSGGGAARS